MILTKTSLRGLGNACRFVALPWHEPDSGGCAGGGPDPRRRCIMPVDGFFEWKAIKGQRAKQPYAIAMKYGAPFAG